MSPSKSLVLPLILLATACGGGSGGSSQRQTVAPPATQNQEVFVAAGAQVLTPSTAPVASGVDLQRLGLNGVSAVYDLTTPVDQPFAVNVFTRGRGNSGAVRVSFAHALDGGAQPTGGPESLSQAGIQPTGTDFTNRSPWIDSNGDGFARVTLSGAIAQDQVIAIQSQNEQGIDSILVRLRIGPVSSINTQPAGIGVAAVKSSATLYSSDSWQFGLPTVATSGDRTSVVVYEGDEGDAFSNKRYEMRLQFDALANKVTGGASDESSSDGGNWRDHEIAALYNVLALVHSGDREATIRLSFDRGATFAQSLVLERGNGFNNRLVQIAMADNYELAVIFWRTVGDFRAELVLVEGRPSKFDASGSPSEFAFDSPQSLHTTSGDATPVIMGAQYSSGGDLVVGYAYTSTTNVAPPQGQTVVGRGAKTDYRCAVRLFGETSFTDTLVDDVVTWSFDPSVALRGSGSSLEIFYGYEAGDGVRLKRSTDAGKTYGGALALGDRSAHMPSVLLRDQAGAQRLDVVYLQRSDFGNELHVAHWDDYDSATAPTLSRLTQATRTPGVGTARSTTTSVAWLGYDACLQGDDVVVVYHEQTYDFMLAMPTFMGVATGGQPTAAPMGAPFTAATPPPLAPGLTQPLPSPEASDRNQLKWICLD